MAATMAGSAEKQWTFDERAAQERRVQLYRTLGIIVGGAIGIGVIGLAGWASWAVAGAIAVKLGLLGFGWHLLAELVIGLPFIFTPIVGVVSSIASMFTAS